MSIQDIIEKFKAYLADDTFFYGMLLILIAVTSFGLGRLSAFDIAPQGQPASIVLSGAPFMEGNASAAVAAHDERGSGETARGEYVGSKNSDKFHHVSCPGASRIKEENRVWFQSVAEAEQAGYTRAANCER